MSTCNKSRGIWRIGDRMSQTRPHKKIQSWLSLFPCFRRLLVIRFFFLSSNQTKIFNFLWNFSLQIEGSGNLSVLYSRGSRIVIWLRSIGLLSTYGWLSLIQGKQLVHSILRLFFKKSNNIGIFEQIYIPTLFDTKMFQNHVCNFFKKYLSYLI